MYTTAKREHEGVNVYPETGHIRVWGFRGTEEIEQKAPQLDDPNLQRPLLAAIKGLREYLDLVLEKGAILDSQGVEQKLNRDYPDALAAALEEQGIVYLTGAQAFRQFGLRNAEINSGPSDMAYIVKASFQDILRYDPERRFVYYEAEKASKGPQLDSFINVLVREGRRIVGSHPPARSVIPTRTLIRQEVFQRALLATAAATA